MAISSQKGSLPVFVLKMYSAKSVRVSSFVNEKAFSQYLMADTIFLPTPSSTTESVSAKCFLLQNKIKTQEDVIDRINKIDQNDINYVLERCFKPGIISTAFVRQGVEAEKLNTILENSKVAYKNSTDEKFLL